MDIKHVVNGFAVAEQLSATDLPAIAAQGFKSIICNRPDEEVAGQPPFTEIAEAAAGFGFEMRSLPVVSGNISDAQAVDFGRLLQGLPKPVLAYCRTGTRSIQLWALSATASGMSTADVITVGKTAGYDLNDMQQRLDERSVKVNKPASDQFQVLIVGGGAGGIAVAASLLRRKSDLRIGIIDSAGKHYYQPGWTMVGGGIFQPESTERSMASVIPRNAKWLKAAVAEFNPDNDTVTLDDGRVFGYERLIVAAGIKLNWAGVEGLVESLGANGVTSNYRYDLAPYTWKLVQGLQAGNAVFTQPPMPIKCAGAPQKALYLSADHWYRNGRIGAVKVSFFNAGAVLFGVKDYVPALMEYMERYQTQINFNHNLIKVDGEKKTAWFQKTNSDGSKETISTEFDMLHVCPPQLAPDFIRNSPLADAAGWVDVDQETLRHKKYKNIWSLGDVMNAPNAKTAAAARKQAPIVACNVLADMGISQGVARYDGYGSCPLTVERGKIVLAEFGFGGKLLPSFPEWLNKGTRPSRLAWILKKDILPPIYWNAMLKGKEWLVKPEPGDK